MTQQRIARAFILGAMLCGSAALAAPQIECRLSVQSAPMYGRVEISFPDVWNAANPDDPRQADVHGVFISPSGAEIRMPGFLYKDFERKGQEIVPSGKPEWRIRFAPTEPGKWKASVQATVNGQTYNGDAGSFDVAPPKARGFVQRAKANPLALEFGNGNPLVAIGSNVFPKTTIDQPVGSERATNTIRYLERTAAAGGTFCRFRMDSWFLPIELPADKASGYEGQGRYHAQSAWEVDRIVEAAERLGVTLMMTIENANAGVNGTKNETRDKFNLYAAEKGGPLKDMKTFWTDPEVKRLFLQRMRYAVARWGYSPSIGVWEFFNEVGLKPENAEAIAQWHAAMSQQWRVMDPYKRPIATSMLGGAIGTKEWLAVFAALDVDLVQYHSYAFTDMAGGLGGGNLRLLKTINKPLIVGEFGTSVRVRESLPGGKGSDPKLDPTGLHLHNGMWASVMTGAAGALPWFITNYIDPLNLYPNYTGLSRFCADWKINEGPWRPIEVSVAAMEEGAGKPRDFDVPTQEAMRQPDADTYRIGRDGSLTAAGKSAESLNGFLFGTAAHKELRRPPAFEVDYPAAGRFIVTVHYAVGKAESPTPVTIDLDGKQAARREFALGEGKGKKAEHIAQYDNWRVVIEDEVAIDVPAGRHLIKVDAQGTDRTSVGYRLTNYATTAPAPYRVFALGYKGDVRFWIQNKENTYYNHYQKKPPTSAPKAQVRVPAQEPGRYEAEWWDTVKGAPIRKATVEAKDGFVALDFPGTLSDEACKLRRIP